MPDRETTYRVEFGNTFGQSIMTIDTLREREIDIGREYKEKEMGLGECYTLKNLEMNIKDGQILYLKVPMTNFLNVLIDNYNLEAIENGKDLIPSNHELL